MPAVIIKKKYKVRKPRRLEKATIDPKQMKIYEKLLGPDDQLVYRNEYFNFFETPRNDRERHARASSLSSILEMHQGPRSSLQEISKQKLTQEDYDIYYEMKNLKTSSNKTFSK